MVTSTSFEVALGCYEGLMLGGLLDVGSHHAFNHAWALAFLGQAAG